MHQIASIMHTCTALFSSSPRQLSTNSDFSVVYLSWADSVSPLEVSSEVVRDLHLWGIICMLLACERGKERHSGKNINIRVRGGGRERARLRWEDRTLKAVEQEERGDRGRGSGGVCLVQGGGGSKIWWRREIESV